MGDEGERKKTLKQFESAIIIFKTLCANFNKNLSFVPIYHKTKFIYIVQEEREAISTEKKNKEVLVEGRVVQNHAG